MTRWGAVVIAMAMSLGGCAGDDDGPSGPFIDAAPQPDADPLCANVNSYGGFPDCSACTAAGTGCDTIDKNGSQSKVCDCTGSCPCGLHCGSIEIAPGVVVSDVCTR